VFYKGDSGHPPKEAWSHKNPQVSRIMVFGYVAYVLTPKEKRDKLDPKCKTMLFIGYSHQSTAYRLMDIVINKINLSADVI
jgi:hypothetical protein